MLVALFSLWNGDGMRDLLSWWGFGAVSLLLLAGAIVLISRDRARAKALVLSWHAVPILAFMALCLMSTAWSDYPAITPVGCFIQLATATVAVGLCLARPPVRLAALFAIMLQATLVISLVFEVAVALSPAGQILPLWTNYSANVPGAYYWSNGLIFEGGRIQGFTANANLLCFQALLAALVTTTLAQAHVITRRLLVPALLLDLLVIALTRSATVIIAAGVVVVGALVIGGLRRFGRRGRIAVLGGSLGFVALVALGSSRIAEPFLRLLGKGDDFTGRLEIWRLVGVLVKDRPILGYGWISYWAPWVDPFRGLVIRDGVQYLQAHNAYLDIQMQLGIPGLLALVAVVGSVVYRALRVALTDRPLAVLPLLLLAALLTQAMAESRLLIEGNWALLVALSVALPLPQAVAARPHDQQILSSAR
ncbi:O-antigen ligase-like membrane protein [Amnibacterium kyonggiense]|uniref:O-antigen ligase-like membrane protein n=1 Tax=Amnibacterium kyonggiense TaxID=595671 RepID=A0A4R7FFL7_9MICO|nr:O-antigen ligase-like membrane protein [Amnibacterium kyonggiense]